LQCTVDVQAIDRPLAPGVASAAIVFAAGFYCPVRYERPAKNDRNHVKGGRP
jgi:hypothetical protein